MKIVVVGGQAGVRAYQNARARLVKAGAEIIKEIDSGQSHKRFSLPAETEMVLVLTTWAGHTAIIQAKKAVGLANPTPRLVLSPHQWSRLWPHLKRAGFPATRAGGVDSQAHGLPTPDDRTAQRTPPAAPEPSKETTVPKASPRPWKDETALRRAVLELVAEMREERVEEMKITKDGKVLATRHIIETLTLDLDLSPEKE